MKNKVIGKPARHALTDILIGNIMFLPLSRKLTKVNTKEVKVNVNGKNAIILIQSTLASSKIAIIK